MFLDSENASASPWLAYNKAFITARGLLKAEMDKFMVKGAYWIVSTI